MAELRVHDVEITHTPPRPRLRVHGITVTRSPIIPTKHLRVHDVWITKGYQPPVSEGARRVRYGGQWLLSTRKVRLGGAWI